MRNIIFACATQDEFEAMKQFVEEREEFSADPEVKDCYVYNNLRILLYNVGITFFNVPHILDAALKFIPDAIYNIGSCAGIDGQEPYTVIASNNCYCNDLDLTAFGSPMGSLGEDSPFATYGPVIVSGSKFLASAYDVTCVKVKFINPVAFDMESFMFKHICDGLKVPFLSVRGVSDSGDENAKVSFEESVRNATRSALVYALGLETEQPLGDRLMKK